MSGVAITRSKSSQPSSGIFLARSSAPTKSAPASRASLLLLALREDEDAHRLAGAVRQHDRAAHHLVGVPRIDAEVHREVDALVELRGRQRLDAAPTASASV